MKGMMHAQALLHAYSLRLPAQVLQSAGSQLRRVQLIDTEIIFDPHREYAAPASEGSTFDRLLALMRQHEFAYTSCFPAINPFQPGNISQVDGQFVNLAMASKQLISELRHAGSDWQWDAAAMAKYWDPTVPYEQKHQGNNEQTWEYGFSTQ